MVVPEEVEAAALVDAVLEAGAPGAPRGPRLRRLPRRPGRRGPQVGRAPPLAAGARPDAVRRRRGGRARAGRRGARGAVRRRAAGVGDAGEGPRASHHILPPTSQTGPWVATTSVSESTRSTRVTPSIVSRRAARSSAAPSTPRRRSPHAAEQRKVNAVREPAAGRVDRRAEERRPVEEGARVDLDLAEEVAPVGRERGERRVPRLGHRCARRRPGAAAVDASATATFETSSWHHVRSSSSRWKRWAAFCALFAPARCDLEGERLADLRPALIAPSTWAARGRSLSCSVVSVSRTSDQSSGQALLDRAPLIDELHRGAA